MSTTQLHAAVSRRTSLSHHPSAGRSSLMELPHSASSFRKDRRTDPLNCTLQYQVQGCLFQSDVHLFNARLRFPAFCGIRVSPPIEGSGVLLHLFDARLRYPAFCGIRLTPIVGIIKTLNLKIFKAIVLSFSNKVNVLLRISYSYLFRETNA